MTSENGIWANLPYFLAVARTGSLRAAAEVTTSTHATVRRRIDALEAAYDARLFERSVDGLVLTEAGEAVLPLAESAEEKIIATQRRLSGRDTEAAGLVRVTVPPSLAFAPMAEIFAGFARTHPDIELDIVVSNRFQDLARHEVDVAVRVAFEVSDDLFGRRTIRYAKGIYAARSYLEARMPQAGPKGEGLEWIGWGDGDPLPEWVRNSPFPKAKLRHTVREGVMQVHLARAGMGITHMPCYAAAAYPELVPVPGSTPVLDRSIWLLLHSDLKRTTRVRLFVDHLAAELRARRKFFLGPLADSPGDTAQQ